MIIYNFQKTIKMKYELIKELIKANLKRCVWGKTLKVPVSGVLIYIVIGFPVLSGWWEGGGGGGVELENRNHW